MSDSSRILIVVDPAHGFDQASVERGSLIASALGRGIELLIVHTDREFTDLRVKNPAGWKKARHKVVNAHADKLEGIAARLAARGHDVILSVTCDRPLDEGIVRHAIYTSPYMVVKEARRRSTIGRALFSDSDWSLTRNCPQPLWLAKSEPWVEGAPLMACVDPGHKADSYATLELSILNCAEELSARLQCDAHIFNAYPPTVGTGISESDNIVTPQAEYQKQYSAEQKLNMSSLLDGYKFSEDNIHLELGFPDKALIDVAGRIDAGLVIMGAIARSQLNRVILGSTTEAVLDKISADVLIIKPSWFECPVDAVSHADARYDPEGHIFQVKAGTRAEWAGNKMHSVE